MKLPRMVYGAFFIMLTACAKIYVIEDEKIPCITPYSKYSFRLVSNYSLSIDGKRYAVPFDFVSDLASIPRILWTIFPPHESQIIAPSILHDYFYSGEVNVSRKFADDVFYNHMVKKGISKAKSYTYWVGLRLFGGFAFKGYNYDQKL